MVDQAIAPSWLDAWHADRHAFVALKKLPGELAGIRTISRWARCRSRLLFRRNAGHCQSSRQGQAVELSVAVQARRPGCIGAASDSLFVLPSLRAVGKQRGTAPGEVYTKPAPRVLGAGTTSEAGRHSRMRLNLDGLRVPSRIDKRAQAIINGGWFRRMIGGICPRNAAGHA